MALVAVQTLHTNWATHVRRITYHSTLGLRVALLGGLSVACSERVERATVDPDGPYITVAKALERFVGHEMADKHLPGLSIALVDDQRIVWARGFGLENPKDSAPATAQWPCASGGARKIDAPRRPP